MNPKISVIIPIYKAEKYIERCAHSLFKQTLQNIEYIFIDDCSPDKSINILREVITKYPSRQNAIKIITHSTNKGVGNSRQDGLNLSTGEYVIHCDPDDWVEMNAYEILYNTAKNFNYDIVICDYVLEYKNNSIIQSFKLENNSIDLLTKLMDGKVHGGLCNKLIRRSLICSNNIKFTANLNICEDLIYCIQLLNHNPSIFHLNNALYHYDKYSNTNSLTGITNRHNKEQYEIWSSAFENVILNKKTRIYATGFTFIAYWAFTHNVLSTKEYMKTYFKSIPLLLRNDKILSIKIITILSALGLKGILFMLYRNFKNIN